MLMVLSNRRIKFDFILIGIKKKRTQKSFAIYFCDKKQSQVKFNGLADEDALATRSN